MKLGNLVSIWKTDIAYRAPRAVGKGVPKAQV